MSHDRRRTDRIPENAMVLLARDIGDPEIQNGRVRDLGEGGACVAVPNAIPPGTSLYVGFFLDGFGGLPLIAKVQVAWARPQGDEHAIGLSFRDEGPAQRHAIERMRDYLAARRRDLVGAST